MSISLVESEVLWGRYQGFIHLNISLSNSIWPKRCLPGVTKKKKKKINTLDRILGKSPFSGPVSTKYNHLTQDYSVSALFIAVQSLIFGSAITSAMQVNLLVINQPRGWMQCSSIAIMIRNIVTKYLELT